MDITVLGVDHWIQRHQDNDAERNQACQYFERAIGRLIEERGVQLVAEEAGNDTQRSWRARKCAWKGFGIRLQEPGVPVPALFQPGQK